MSRRSRTDAELRGASDAVWYEIWMLRSVAQGLASGVFGQGPITNAMLESFTIHARCLLDFLYAENPWEDDVIAEDYFSSGETWETFRPPEPAALGMVRSRVGKEVAHLTYARLAVTPEMKGWAFLEIAEAFQGAIDRFAASVPTDFLGDRWGADVIRRRRPM